VALVFSGFPGLAQLGVFSVAGLVAAALATRYVLPALMPDGSRGTGLRAPLGRAAACGGALAAAPALPVLLLGVVAAVVLWQRGDLWRADLASLSPVPRAAIELDERCAPTSRSATAARWWWCRAPTCRPRCSAPKRRPSDWKRWSTRA
jgi:predicted exporter